MINDVSGVNLEEVLPSLALSNKTNNVASAAGKKVSLFDIKRFKVKVIHPTYCTNTVLIYSLYNLTILIIIRFVRC